ncbi:MAG: hypothetical protein PHV34_17530 [Verrucomicrobiae bacterium]|nr:hypothetical protein [Verrucomicrobiae bacterium]
MSEKHHEGKAVFNNCWRSVIFGVATVVAVLAFLLLPVYALFLFCHFCWWQGGLALAGWGCVTAFLRHILHHAGAGEHGQSF